MQGSQVGERRGGRQPLVTNQIAAVLRFHPNGLSVPDIASRLKMNVRRIAPLMSNSKRFKRAAHKTWVLVEDMKFYRHRWHIAPTQDAFSDVEVQGDVFTAMHSHQFEEVLTEQAFNQRRKRLRAAGIICKEINRTFHVDAESIP